jgi:hypothetical protein
MSDTLQFVVKDRLADLSMFETLQEALSEFSPDSVPCVVAHGLDSTRALDRALSQLSPDHELPRTVLNRGSSAKGSELPEVCRTSELEKPRALPV